VLLTVGLGLAIGGAVELRRNLRRSEDDCPDNAVPCRDLVTRGLSLRAAGLGLIGAGLGSAAAFAVYLSPRPRVRTAVWAGEAAVGLVGVVAGAVGVGLSAGAYNDMNQDVAWTATGYRDDVQRLGAQHSAAAFFLGMGTSLLVRSLSLLVWNRQIERAARRERLRERRGPILEGARG
jgi:hypothetical protein